MSRKSILRQIAELSNPTPRDYDPEDVAPDFESSDADQEEDDGAGREHYLDVGERRLRGAETILKDAKYRGSRTQRRDLFQGPRLEDVKPHSSGALSSDEDEGVERKDSEVEYVSSGEEESDMSGISDEDSLSEEEYDGSENDQEDRQGQIREMLAQETKTVAKQISESTQADADKGKDIETQQRFYEQLLDVRIRLQKVLVALNSLPQGDNVEAYKNADSEEFLNSAREQAYSLFLKTFNLSNHLHRDQNGQPKLKRKFAETSMTNLLESLEPTSELIQSWREEILTKWSDKVRAAQGLPLTKKFKAINQSITHQLHENLVDKPRLLTRLHTKRAPFTRLATAQTLDEGREIVDPEIFDDLDFYHPLLKDLVERKQIDVPVGLWEWTKQRKGTGKSAVKDTRASKGRKLRYHEHEKIQNFMAPVQVGTWHEDQIDELFASLLGRQIQVDEEAVLMEIQDIPQDGLRIFG